MILKPLNLPHARSMDEVATIMGITRQRVEQIERSAVFKLSILFLDEICDDDPARALSIINKIKQKPVYSEAERARWKRATAAKIERRKHANRIEKAA